MPENTFTFDELRITLTAFALWFGAADPTAVVDRFFQETLGDD